MNRMPVPGLVAARALHATKPERAQIESAKAVAVTAWTAGTFPANEVVRILRGWEEEGDQAVDLASDGLQRAPLAPTHPACDRDVSHMLMISDDHEPTQKLSGRLARAGVPRGRESPWQVLHQPKNATLFARGGRAPASCR